MNTNNLSCFSQQETLNQLRYLPHYFIPLVFILLFLSTISPVKADDSASANSLTIVIQPVYGMERTYQAFKPLGDYLEQVTGKNIILKTYPNFLTYWNETRDGHGYDLILDAAHFTGYRARELNFDILAKVLGTVSYSVIVSDTALVLDTDELIGKKIATLGPPSMGAAKVSLLFANPLRQPYIYETENSEKALDLLYTGEVDAAVIPTPLVATLTGVFVVTTTEPTQHIALSASPSMDSKLKLSISNALIKANSNDAGRRMLGDIGFAGFEGPDTERYVIAADILHLAGLY